jgi:hypothetical protein
MEVAFMSPIKVTVEIYYTRHDDGTFSAGAREVTESGVGLISGHDNCIFRGTVSDLQTLKNKLDEIYGEVQRMVES